MNIVVLTPIRLLGDGLSACISHCPQMKVLAVVSDFSRLRSTLDATETDLVLIDVTQGIDLHDVRALAAGYPGKSLVALGLTEQRQDVIRCGQAGFTGYISRETPADALCEALTDVAAGRLVCSAEISSGLLRALYLMEKGVQGPAQPADTDPALTRREAEVLHLLGEARSNKEIARALCISVATVKHHVHNVLEKLHLQGRAQAVRRLRDAPGLAGAPAVMAQEAKQ
ncbi:response regulator transcription factor [Massilia genomosp. 1]|uniref:DNA-binding response regulator n=1 Tax=Massilia genomosp. 1 TaxID=2609280 RepID=A0ABX0MPB6_9BURK|nr:response regulator transcription factor [Massilia genomosp. 1]NHZ64619.1 DNA-binding response regulator [Massilia genomosp. 1]